MCFFFDFADNVERKWLDAMIRALEINKFLKNNFFNNLIAYFSLFIYLRTYFLITA